ERDVTGFNANSGKNQHPQSACQTNTYSPQSGAQEDRKQNYDEFYNEQISIPDFLNSLQFVFIFKLLITRTNATILTCPSLFALFL
ncbi:hypothetical protein, partial [Escherichia coli]|uniref:hypothetical protein n=1 Tax=Escherichia coli TaxID=562 RepID=UPI0024E17101